MISASTGRGGGELRWVEKDDRITNESYFQYSCRQHFGRAWFGRSEGRGSSGGTRARSRASVSAGFSSAELSSLTG